MDYLYGKLNNEVKYREYKGSETTTATVTIDDSSTVSVDVKKVPNELTLTTINGDTYTYDVSETTSFDIRTQVTDKVEEGNNLPVTSDAVKGYVDSKAGALEYVGGEGKFTNINGGVTVKGRLNVDDGIYSPVNSDDPNFVPNNKSVDDKITASEQKLIDERIGAFTRTADKLFTDVEGGMTVKGHLNVDGGITSASAPTSYKDVTNKGYVDGSRLFYIGTTSIKSAIHDDTGTHLKSSTIMRTKSGLDYQGSTEMLIPIVGKDGVIIENDSDSIVAVKADVEAIQKDMAGRFGNNSLWYTSTTGEPSGFGVTDAGDSGAIPVITDGLRLPETIPDENYVAVHKKYVDDGFVPKQIPADTRSAYTTNTNGEQSLITIHGGSAVPFSIASRSEGGVVRVGTPVGVNDATTKKYVDDADAKKLNLTGGTITGSLAIQGDLTVTGTTTTEKTQTLAVKDSVIITNADGAELGATLSGIAIKKDGENTYGVMYDPSGDSVKLGLGTLDAENKFTFNESGTDGKPIATRADSSALTDGDLVKWDGTTNSLVDSGKKTDDFVPKVTVTEGSNLAYIAHFGGGQGTIPVEVVPIRGSLVQRTVDGIVKVGTPVNENDATTKKYVDDKFVAKVTTTSGSNLAYIAKNDGTQSTVPIAQMPYQNTVAQRGAGGTLKVGKAVEDSDAMPKKQVEDGFLAKQEGIVGQTRVYTVRRDNNGSYQDTAFVDANYTEWSVALRAPGGVLRVGTPVGVNDATTKQYVDDGFVAKVTTTSGSNLAYVAKNDGTQGMFAITTAPAGGSLAQRKQNGGALEVGKALADSDAMPKKQVEDGFVKKGTSNSACYCIDYTGSENMVNYSIYLDKPYTLAQRDVDYTLKVGTPVGVSDATTKKYVDDGFVAKVTPSNNLTYVYSRDENGDKSVQATSMMTGNTLAYRDANGNIGVGTPTEDAHATTKKYVDDRFVAKQTTTAPNQSYLYGYDSNGDRQFGVTGSAAPGTIAYRSNGGRLKVGKAVEDSDAMTKKQVEDGFVAKIGTATQIGTILYGRDFNGNEKGYIVESIAHNANTMVQRKSGGAVEVGTAVQDSDAMPKKQIEDGFVAKTSTTEVVYATDSSGVQKEVPYTAYVVGDSIVLRDSKGHINVANPNSAYHATNKAYVDNLNAITITAGA